MKKLVLSIICAIIYVSTPIAFASDSLPASFVCSSDSNTLLTFNSSQTFEGFFSCSGTPFSLAIHGADTYSIVECNPDLGDCTDTDYTSLLASSAYVDTTSYTWTTLPDGSCPADVICYHDWLIMNMIIVFFLSLMSMGIFINFFKRK
jgi:hypothetical protein